MAFSKEYQTKLNKQVAILNEASKQIAVMQRAFQFAQHETSPDNPHSAYKDEAAFDTLHSALIRDAIVAISKKLDELKAELAA